MEVLGGWIREYLPAAIVLALPALLLWGLLVVRRRDRGLTMRRTIREAGADVLLAVSLGAILALTILPGGEATGPATGQSLVPFEDLIRSFDPRMRNPAFARDAALSNLAANLALFVPFGLALGLRFPGAPHRRLLLVCLGLSLGIEAVQLVWSVGRSADVTDVIMNTVGGAVGILAAGAVIRVVRHPVR